MYLGIFATAEEAAHARDNYVRAKYKNGAWRSRQLPRYNFPRGQEYGLDMVGVTLLEQPNGHFTAQRTVQVTVPICLQGLRADATAVLVSPALQSPPTSCRTTYGPMTIVRLILQSCGSH